MCLMIQFHILSVGTGMIASKRCAVQIWEVFSKHFTTMAMSYSTCVVATWIFIETFNPKTQEYIRRSCQLVAGLWMGICQRNFGEEISQVNWNSYHSHVLPFPVDFYEVSVTAIFPARSMNTKTHPCFRIKVLQLQPVFGPFEGLHIKI